MTDTNKGLRPVRMNKDVKTYEYGIAVGFSIGLMNFYPASVFGLSWLWLSFGLTSMFTVIYAYELKWPNPRLQFIAQWPVLFIGPLWFLAVFLTLWAGQRLRGLWLILLVLAGLHIVVMNVLTLRYADIDGIIASMVRMKVIEREEGGTYFLIPSSIGNAANLPGWLQRWVWPGRCFWFAVMVFGAVVFAPGVYSSVGIENRLLNVVGTLGLGFSVLFTRLWHVPVFRQVQRRFGEGQDL